jgi:carbohydrate kinase (thermoresistant glucokinase family)
MRDRSVYHYLPQYARKKILALPSDFSQASLGLQEYQYSEIASEITGLIHCAWSVNFNLSLGSFEADCISGKIQFSWISDVNLIVLAGAHNLISLCLKALRPKPATFNFCSSVSAVAATKGGFVSEALPASFDCAQNMGYAQSKLVTEHICVNAARSYGIETRVLRVGQVVADTAHGIWNATEAIPLMLQAGITIGAIPSLDENPLWLPVDIVASGVADISLSTAGPGVMNVVNHRSFHWTRDLLPALHQAGLEFSEPSQKEWVDLLRNSNQDPTENPPIKLFSFFASKFDNDQPPTSLTYDTSYARFLSPSLAAAPVISQPLVTKFINNFQATSWKTGLPSIPTKRLIIIAGPCGSGKSTVASAASKEFNVPWIEGDNLHSEGSIKKMAASIPLTDDDRWLWLETIKASALLQLSENGCENIIVTCSALKRIYREELRRSKVLKTTFVMLQAEDEVLKHRVAEREGHYMGRDMVESQVTSLQSPGVDEVDVVPVDMEGEKEATISEVLEILRRIF